jgi:hypothetical protein
MKLLVFSVFYIYFIMYVRQLLGFILFLARTSSILQCFNVNYILCLFQMYCITMDKESCNILFISWKNYSVCVYVRVCL